MNVMCVICRVDAVNGRMEIVPVQDVEKHYDYLINGEVFDRRADLYITDGPGFKNANGGLHSHVPLMFGTALPLGQNGSVSAYQRTIVTARFLDGRPYYQQTVTTGDWRPRRAARRRGPIGPRTTDGNLGQAPCPGRGPSFEEPIHHAET
mgnify:CR=1 FL=1